MKAKYEPNYFLSFEILLLSLPKKTEGKSHPMKKSNDTTDKSREVWTVK